MPIRTRTSVAGRLDPDRVPRGPEAGKQRDTFDATAAAEEAPHRLAFHPCRLQAKENLPQGQVFLILDDVLP